MITLNMNKEKYNMKQQDFSYGTNSFANQENDTHGNSEQRRRKQWQRMKDLKKHIHREP